MLGSAILFHIATVFYIAHSVEVNWTASSAYVKAFDLCFLSLSVIVFCRCDKHQSQKMFATHPCGSPSSREGRAGTQSRGGKAGAAADTMEEQRLLARSILAYSACFLT